MAINLIVIGDYYLNKTQIAEELCVNKDVPESCCEGKCYMNKQLEKEEKKQNPTPISIKEKTEVNYLLQSSCKYLFVLSPTLFFLKFNYQQYTCIDVQHPIFHPPNNILALYTLLKG